MFLLKYMRRFTGDGFARTLCAAVLALSLAAAIAPFGALSSGHICAKPCCAAGNGSCATGACDVEFSAPKKPTQSGQPSHCADDSMSMAGDHDMQIEDESASLSPTNDSRIVEFPSCDESHQALPREPSAVRIADQAPTTSIQPSAFSEPCPPDCGAAAGSFSASRKSKEQAVLNHAQKPRPPTIVRQAQSTTQLIALSLHTRSLASPRAPPTHLNK